MSETSDRNFDAICKKIAENEGIENAKLEIQNSGSKGDGYVGNIRALELRGTNKKLNLIVKYAPKTIGTTREKLPVHEIFVQENSFYDIVYPTLKKFQESHGIKDKFDGVAKCYATVYDEGEELLVMENLRTAGYDLWNRKQLMNREHLEFVFRTFAKLHGTSFAMRKLNPDLFKQELIDKFFGSNDFMKSAFEDLKMGKVLSEIFTEFVSYFNAESEKRTSEKLMEYAQISEDDFRRILSTRDPNSVVTQGDSWCNNMMFRYKDDQKREMPCEMKLLDFQITRLASPVCDLSYFFYGSASKEAMDDLDNYLKYYHNELSKYLNQYGLDVDDIYPFEELMDGWKKYSGLGFGISLIIRKVMLADAEETPELNKRTDNPDGNFLNEFRFVSKYEDEYRRQVKQIIEHCVQRELI